MSGSVMFAVAWVSMATSVYAWGAVMIVACRTLDIWPRRAVICDGADLGLSWFMLTLTTVFLPAAVGILVYDSVQIYQEVRR